MSEKLSNSFNDLSTVDSCCCSTQCVIDNFNQRLQSLEEILNKNVEDKKEQNIEFKEKNEENKEIEFEENKIFKKKLEIIQENELKQFNENNKLIKENTKLFKNLEDLNIEIKKYKEEKLNNEQKFNYLLDWIELMNFGILKNTILEQPSLGEKIDLLIFKLEQLNKENDNKVLFIPLSNKIDLPGKIDEMSSFISIEEDGILKYNFSEKKNYSLIVYGQNSFKKELSCGCLNILFYFEITMIKEISYKSCNASIGVDDNNSHIYLSNDNTIFVNNKRKSFQKFHWKDNDIFGCGLIFKSKKGSEPFLFLLKME